MADAPTKLRLRRLRDPFAICRLSPRDLIPAWCANLEWVSITRTRHELSIVCPEEAVPLKVQAERGWIGFEIVGPLPLPFTAVGVLASLATPLAKAGIPIFVVSTHDTDYLFVRKSDVGQAEEVLVARGHTVEPQ